jgi:hypothetical protein
VDTWTGVRDRPNPKETDMSRVRRFAPVYLDHYQAAAYRHVATTVELDGSLVAHFADGTSQPSVYATVAEMLEAGRRDYREWVCEVGEAVPS